MGRLEHVNVTVADPDATAAMLGKVFGWRVRWSGASIHDGYSLHVGSETSYIALYTCPDGLLREAQGVSYFTRAAMNHLAIVVDDLDAVEAKVIAHGYEAHSHADYEPGRRFYFREENGIEIEVVQYD
ncbi:MAG: VOC family protein [Yoonia sp.]|uniref:VOC family protein n=1 Tax=Yoonia sp. TaxID=2212373 RepID=UPI003EF28FD4